MWWRDIRRVYISNNRMMWKFTIREEETSIILNNNHIHVLVHGYGV